MPAGNHTCLLDSIRLSACVGYCRVESKPDVGFDKKAKFSTSKGFLESFEMSWRRPKSRLCKAAILHRPLRDKDPYCL